MPDSDRKGINVYKWAIDQMVQQRHLDMSEPRFKDFHSTMACFHMVFPEGTTQNYYKNPVDAAQGLKYIELAYQELVKALSRRKAL